MSSSGWVKLHRKIMESCLGDADNPAEVIGFFAVLLMKANREDKLVFNRIPVRRGQIVTSKRKLMEYFHFRYSKLKKYLDDFVTAEIITYHYEGNAMIITVLNYDKYQGERVSTNVNTYENTSVNANENTSVNTNENTSVTQTRSNKEYIENDIRNKRKEPRIYD